MQILDCRFWITYLLGVPTYFACYVRWLDPRTQKQRSEAERQTPLQNGRWTTLHCSHSRRLYHYWKWQRTVSLLKMHIITSSPLLSTFPQRKIISEEMIHCSISMYRATREPSLSLSEIDTLLGSNKALCPFIVTIM